MYKIIQIKLIILIRNVSEQESGEPATQRCVAGSLGNPTPQRCGYQTAQRCAAGKILLNKK